MLCSVDMINFSGISIHSERVIDFLKQETRLRGICQEIVCQNIIHQFSQDHHIVITDEEIQVEANRQRYDNRLESAADTYAWLREQLINADDWEAGIRKHLQAKKLADILFKDTVQPYFTQHQVEYDQAVLYHIVVPYELLANEIFYQIEEEEISFYEAAHLYDIDRRRRLYCGYDGLVHRWNLEADISAFIFGARPREVLGPIQTKDGFNLYMVEEFLSAELTDEVAEKITQKLFNEWLLRELNYRIHNNNDPNIAILNEM
jgi:parvulin-like peptidyl-prolyl isomerase